MTYKILQDKQVASSRLLNWANLHLSKLWATPAGIQTTSSGRWSFGLKDWRCSVNGTSKNEKHWRNPLSRLPIVDFSIWRRLQRKCIILSHSLGSSDQASLLGNEHDISCPLPTIPTIPSIQTRLCALCASSHRMAHYAFPPSAGLHWRDLEMSRVSWSLELKPLKHQPAPWNVQLFSWKSLHILTQHDTTTWILLRGHLEISWFIICLKKMLFIMCVPYFSPWKSPCFTVVIAESLLVISIAKLFAQGVVKIASCTEAS